MGIYDNVTDPRLLEERLHRIESKQKQTSGGSSNIEERGGKLYYRSATGKLIPLASDYPVQPTPTDNGAMTRANDAYALASAHASRHRAGGDDQLFDQDLDTTSDITLASATLSNLTANRLAVSDGSKKVISLANLATFVAGTTNRVSVADDGDGTITLSAPQDIHTTASPTFAGLSLIGTIDTTELTVTGVSGQTASLQTWQDSTGKLLSRMNKLGEWYTTDSGTEANSSLLGGGVSMYIAGAEASPGINAVGIVAHTTASSRMVFAGARCRGTLQTPTAASSGDSVVSLLGNIYDGAAVRASASITFIVESAVSSGVAPQAIVVQTGTSSRTERWRWTSAGHYQAAEGMNIILGSTTGTQIGTATTQKIAFYGGTPVVRAAAYTQNYTTATRTMAINTYSAPSGGTVIDANARTAMAALKTDFDNLKQVVTSLIDDAQGYNLAG